MQFTKQIALTWSTKQVYDWICTLGPSFEPFAARLQKAGFDGKKIIGLAGFTTKEFESTLYALEGDQLELDAPIALGHKEKLLAEIEEACLAVKLTDEGFLQREMERCVDGVMRASETENNELCVLYSVAFCSLIRKAILAIDPIILNSGDKSVLKQRRQTLILLNDVCKLCDAMIWEGSKEPATAASVLSVVLVLAESAAGILLMGYGSSLASSAAAEEVEEPVTLPPEILNTLDLKEDEENGLSSNDNGNGSSSSSSSSNNHSSENLLNLDSTPSSPFNIPPGTKLLETEFGPENSFIETRTVYLVKKPEEKFGLAISLGGPDYSMILIGNLAPGGVAEQSGQVFKGDEIVSVNGKSVYGFLPENVKTLIMVSSEKLAIELRTYPPEVASQLFSAPPTFKSSFSAQSSPVYNTATFANSGKTVKFRPTPKEEESANSGSSGSSSNNQSSNNQTMRKQSSLSAMQKNSVSKTTDDMVTGNVNLQRKMSAPPATLQTAATILAAKQPTKSEIPAIPCRDLINPKLTGWLWKLGGSGFTPKNWRKRWFVLHECNLYYYKTAFDRKPLGMIILPAFTISDAPEIKKKFAFKAAHAGMRTYFFFTDSKEDMLKWMNYLSLAAIKFFTTSEIATPSYQQPKLSNSGSDKNLSKKKDTVKKPVAPAPEKPKGPTIDELAEFNNRKSLYDPNYGLPRPGDLIAPVKSPGGNLPAAVLAANAAAAAAAAASANASSTTPAANNNPSTSDNNNNSSSSGSSVEPKRVRVASPVEEASIDIQTKLKKRMERLQKKEAEFAHICQLFSSEITSERLQQFMMSARQRDSIYFGLDKDTLDQLKNL